MFAEYIVLSCFFNCSDNLLLLVVSWFISCCDFSAVSRYSPSLFSAWVVFARSVFRLFYSYCTCASKCFCCFCRYSLSILFCSVVILS